MLSSEQQAVLRLEIFADLELLVDSRGGFASRDELTGFVLQSGLAMPLIDTTRGIRNPRSFDATLAIVSASDGGRNNPYDDAIDRKTGLLRYSWAKGPVDAGDNRKLTIAFESGTPIILFEKPLPNLYVPVFPVYVIAIDHERRHFIIDLDENRLRGSHHALLDKNYIERVVKQRVHQPMFRARVLSAYDRGCAVCTLNYRELLDAAHIIGDSDSRGLPIVTNGMAMCTIHHRAYDQNFLGISPDYKVHINERLLADRDGPMLLHGLQEMDGRSLTVPSQSALKPNRAFLAERYETFCTAD